MTKSNKTTLAVVAALWLTLGVVYSANAAPATTAPAMAPARPVAMAPARPAARPAPRPVAMAPVRRPAPKPAAMPAPVMAAAPAAATMAAPAPVMAVDPAPAMAAVPEKTTAAPAVKKDTKGQVVGGWILQVLLYLLGIFLTAFIPVFTAWLYKKFKLTDLEQKDKIDQMVLKATLFGIGKAEEAAHKLRDNPMDSAKKMDTAIAAANKYLVDSGLPEKGAEYLADLIESKLGETRNNAATKPAAKPEEKPAEAEKTEDKPKEDDK